MGFGVEVQVFKILVSKLATVFGFGVKVQVFRILSLIRNSLMGFGVKVQGFTVEVLRILGFGFQEPVRFGV